mmetsp:Transcript_10610/g.25135  ORF Transcript_10610/g.25135 Transcript_10610/m.25135 type:complete len:537 (+) Transcript_10610:154-1764(+)
MAAPMIHIEHSGGPAPRGPGDRDLSCAAQAVLHAAAAAPGPAGRGLSPRLAWGLPKRRASAASAARFGPCSGLARPAPRAELPQVPPEPLLVRGREPPGGRARGQDAGRREPRDLGDDERQQGARRAVAVSALRVVAHELVNGARAAVLQRQPVRQLHRAGEARGGEAGVLHEGVRCLLRACQRRVHGCREGARLGAAPLRSPERERRCQRLQREAAEDERLGVLAIREPRGRPVQEELRRDLEARGPRLGPRGDVRRRPAGRGGVPMQERRGGQRRHEGLHPRRLLSPAPRLAPHPRPRRLPSRHCALGGKRVGDGGVGLRAVGHEAAAVAGLLLLDRRDHHVVPLKALRERAAAPGALDLHEPPPDRLLRELLAHLVGSVRGLLRPRVAARKGPPQRGDLEAWERRRGEYVRRGRRRCGRRAAWLAVGPLGGLGRFTGNGPRDGGLPREGRRYAHRVLAPGLRYEPLGTGGLASPGGAELAPSRVEPLRGAAHGEPFGSGARALRSEERVREELVEPDALHGVALEQEAEELLA